MRLVRAPKIEGNFPPILDDERLEAAQRLHDRFPNAHLRRTPLLRSEELDRVADPAGSTHVWLALESMQTTGSFKVRGALYALSKLAEKGLEVVAASAGNHGAAVAFAAKLLGVTAKVVVPASAPKVKCARIALGAEVVASEGIGYDAAEDLAKRIAEESGAIFLSPYDDLDVVAGNGASVGFEIRNALGREPDHVFAPFGGGGLVTGLACALGESKVWGVQSEASPVMAMSLERGEAIERFVPTKPTLAEGLEGGISKAAFERARQVIAGVIVLDENAIAAAIEHALHDLGLVLEGSAAVALAAVLQGLPNEARGGEVVIVLTGRNTDRISSHLGRPS
ncbi:MAG TPA: pyridoxal-phosphate dependent enzyme [Polyangiaceae bacterium]